jgi:hypothetical protein
MMAGLPWILIGVLAATGIGMALISSLVGMRQKIENPAWWGLYAIWITIVLILSSPASSRDSSTGAPNLYSSIDTLRITPGMPRRCRRHEDGS